MRSLFLSAAILLAGTASAQHLEAGIEGGFGYANISGTEKNKIRTSTAAGIYVQSDRRLYLRIGAAISSKGARTEGGQYQLNYVSFPVMIGLRSSSRRFFAQAGPYIGTLASARLEGQNVKRDFKSTDVGLALGSGAVFPLNGHIDLTTEVRGELGFTNLNPRWGQFLVGGDPDQPALRNYAFHLLVGIRVHR